MAADIKVYWFRQEDGRSPEEKMATALFDYTGKTVDLQKWSIYRGERGKPFFAEQPQTFLSISHSGAYWACGLAAVPVGIDLQRHDRRRGETKKEAELRCGKLARRFFHKDEAAYVWEEDIYRRFFQIWAAKESYVKYTGSGIDDNFGRFSVLPNEGNSLSPYLSEEQDICWQGNGVWFTEYPEESRWGKLGYTLCVCRERKAQVRVVFL